MLSCVQCYSTEYTVHFRLTFAFCTYSRTDQVKPVNRKRPAITGQNSVQALGSVDQSISTAYSICDAGSSTSKVDCDASKIINEPPTQVALDGVSQEVVVKSAPKRQRKEIGQQGDASKCLPDGVSDEVLIESAPKRQADVGNASTAKPAEPK